MSDAAPIEIECPQCQKRLRVPAKVAGKRIHCPACKEIITVPAETGTTAVSPKRPAKPPPPPKREDDDSSRDEDDEERPARSRRRSRDEEDDGDDDDVPARSRRRRGDDDDEEGDRPRRRRRDEEDDEDKYERPLKRRKSRPASGVFLAAAISLLVIAGLGLVVDLFGSVFALVGTPQPVNPNDPPFMQGMAKGMHGTTAAVSQGFFAVVSGLTIIGSIQMLRRKTWGLALAACILSMINIGNCCCALGLPIGIWALILLCNPEVKEGFS